jgi:putative nucleotidyltransferase with HDIG domain
MSWIAHEGIFDESHVQALSNVPCVSVAQIQQAAGRLPVFPAVAMRAMRLAADPMASTAALEEIVSADPVLAGEILKAANSPRYSVSGAVRTIRQAALLIGLPECCKVIAAASMRPMFSVSPGEGLWKHSIEIASLAEQIARSAHLDQPQEAFFAGLVHDIGRLAFFALPRQLSARYAELLQQEVEAVFAELLLCGFDHAAVGGDIARQWLLPEDLVEAVEKHHEPERAAGPLASVLYLAEHWSNSQEDFPSLTRLSSSLERLSLRPHETFGPLM